MRSSLASSVQIAVSVSAWQIETATIQHAHDLGYGAEPGEHPEHHSCNLFLNSHVGIPDNHAAWIPNQADRQGESELAAFSFGQQPGGQSATDRMQFEFLISCPSNREAGMAVGAARIIDAVAIGDEAASTQATDVQEGVLNPNSCDAKRVTSIDRISPTSAEADPPYELVEATAWVGGCSAQAKIGIDHVDVGLMPAEFVGALTQPILQPQALLVAHHLMGCRLADVDHGLARQMEAGFTSSGLAREISARTAATSSTI